MSKKLQYPASAIETYVFYEMSEDVDSEQLQYEKMCKLIGQNGISRPDFMELLTKVQKNKKSLKPEMKQRIVDDPGCLSLFLIAEIKNSKPFDNAYESICLKVKSDNLDFHVLESMYNEMMPKTSSNGSFDFLELPTEICLNISEKADYRAQMSLRKVSHNVRSLMESIDLEIDELFLKVDGRKNCSVVTIWKSKNGKRDEDFTENIYEGENYIENSFIDLSVILKNPRLRLKTLSYCSDSEENTEQKFIQLLASLNKLLPINSLILDVNRMEIDLIMKHIEVREFHELDMKLAHDPIFIERLAEMDQWFNLKYVHLRSIVADFSQYIHQFEHLAGMFVRVEALSIEDILSVKQMMIVKESMESVTLICQDTPSETEIQQVLGIPEFNFQEDDECFSGLINIPGSNFAISVTQDETMLSLIQKRK